MPSSAPWVFITTTPSHTRPSGDQRLEIQRRVMREIGASRRATDKKIAKFPPNLTQDDWISVEGSSDSQESLLSPSPTPAPIALVAPSTLDGDSRILFQHMFSDALPSYFRIYRDRWYPVCIAHFGAFNQMLATYAMHLLLWRQTSVGALRCLILTHHVKALAAVRDGLPSASGGQTCEGMLCAIVALACYAHLQGDLPGWKQHMSAINRIIEQSYFTWADLSPGIQNLVQWVDCIGSYALDIPPTMDHKRGDKGPTPGDLPTSAPAAISMRLAGLCPTMWEAFSSLESMNTQIELRYAQEGELLWQRPGEVDALVHPVTRKFLSLSQDSGASSARTCLRSGALLYLAEFRRRSGISPVATGLHVQQLCLGLRKCWGLDPTLRLWLLTVGAIEGSGSFEAESLDRLLEGTLHEMNIVSMAGWQDSLKEIVWLDALFNWKLVSVSGNLVPSVSHLLCDS